MSKIDSVEEQALNVTLVIIVVALFVGQLVFVAPFIVIIEPTTRAAQELFEEKRPSLEVSATIIAVAWEFEVAKAYPSFIDHA